MRLLVLILFAPVLAGAPAEKWKLVWSDEFNGNKLDYSKWGVEENAFGGGNHEMQIYTDRAKNVRVAGGKLIIEAHKDNAQIAGTQRPFSSGRVRTKHRGDWRYGRIEVRAKLPAGQGLWPAIWMLPSEWKYGGWPNSGEIDIMEHVGHTEGTVYGTVHTGLYNHLNGTDVGGSTNLDSVNNKFHTYSIEWSEEKIDFFVDEKNYFTFKNDQKGISRTWPFNENFHLIMNVAVGGNWPGSPDNTTIFPQHLVVDYVRVFERDVK